MLDIVFMGTPDFAKESLEDISVILMSDKINHSFN